MTEWVALSVNRTVLPVGVQRSQRRLLGKGYASERRFPVNRVQYLGLRERWSVQRAHESKTYPCNPGWLESLGTQLCAGLLCVLTLVGSAAPAAAAQSLHSLPSYDAVAQRHKGGVNSNLPSAEEAESYLEANRDMFTDEAFDAMKRLIKYAEYVTSQQDAEDAPGCEQCANNRLLLEKAWQVVANEYYDPHGHFRQADWADELQAALERSGGVLHNKRETYAAAKDLMAALGDKYTEFLPPAQFRKALRRPQPAERNYYEAQFTGIGLQFGNRASSGGWLVDTPLSESPAEEAGILHGDRILEIDGYPTDKLTYNEVNAVLRGPAGSTVALTVAPAKGVGTREVFLERRPLPQPAVKQAPLMLADHRKVAYLRLHFFGSEATKSVWQAVRWAEQQNIAGYVLDLRNNPGGVFEEAIATAALFLPPGELVAETLRSDSVVDAVWQTGRLPTGVFETPPFQLTTAPVVLLTNVSSASASEVLAGALHDNNRALLIGQQTFGKGVVQYYFPMTDGSGVKVTVAKYLTPSQYDISQQGGIHPDVACSDFPHGDPVSPENDDCIRMALDYIQNATSVSG